MPTLTGWHPITLKITEITVCWSQKGLSGVFWRGFDESDFVLK